MDERAKVLLEGVPRESRVLEIGPSYNPLAPKSAGWHTTVVDHAGRADLVAKYAADPSVDTGRIEEVDVIWTGGPLDEALPPASRGTFTALVASHVLEHVPDAIEFFRSAAALLDPVTGTLRLALPDLRWCFDVFRPPSTTGQMLAAHRDATGRHSYAALFDHVASLARLEGRAGWVPEPLGKLALDHTLEQALAHAERATRPGAEYVDCHAWQFTPASFALVVLELASLGLIDWQVEWILPRPATEFLVSLRRGRPAFATPSELQSRRAELRLGVLQDMAALGPWLPPRPDAPKPASP